jgi:hypothetical protein
MEHDRRIFFYLARAKVIFATSTANVLSTYDLSIWPNRIGFPLFDFNFHDESTGTGTTGRFHLTPSAIAKEKRHLQTNNTGQLYHGFDIQNAGHECPLKNSSFLSLISRTNHGNLVGRKRL